MNIQNIYDNLDFFKGYKELRKNNLGFNALIEQPALRSLLENLSGKIVLDIGCGFGDFCRYACDQGATRVIGIDPSHNMIQDAKRESKDYPIEYYCAPIETYQTDYNQFDVITSSVVFHYVKDFELVVHKIASWLKPRGQLVFSVEHPICTAQPNPILREDEQGKFHPIYNYRDEGLFKQTWLIEDVEKYHRTLSTYINTLLKNNFILNRVLEPMPTDEEIRASPHFAIHKIRPPLLVISATKR